MATYSPFELDPIFIDLKNTSYGLGLDIQANQNDTLTLNFICRNNGIEEDMSKYKVELRVHNNNSNTDYIQTQNENVVLGADGSVKIVCQSLKGNKLTAYSGQLNGVLKIFNTENKQKATRIITMRIIADPLETDRANICESTITKLEELDWILNEAYNISDEFKKAIKEAIKQKDALIKTTNEAKVINTTLAGNITTGTELNSNLVNSNKLAEINQKELDTRNTTANKNIGTLIEKNTIANETIINISNKITTGSKLDNDLGAKIPAGTTLKNDLDTNIKIGTTLKNDLTELIPKANISKSNLDKSKTNADISKENLDTANVQAEKNIEALNSLGNVTDLAKNVQTNTTDIGTLKENVENNTSQLKDIMNSGYFDIAKDAKGADYKIIRDSGLYRNVTGIPTTIGGGILQVIAGQDKWGIAYRWYHIANSVVTEYISCKDGDNFEGWKQLATVDDTGWIDISSTINSKAKGSARVRRISSQVFLEIQWMGVIPENETIATMPSSYAPKGQSEYVFCRFAGGTITLCINGSGTIVMDHTNTGTQNNEVTCFARTSYLID
ncbi:DUF2479 domain-containing protein [Clostridium botulinum]|nr:DUF2479 domain-containing protein [Clostridium botulinum]